ncbi:hypothetical protein [Umezawaea beigongshangensis]|uniref:hypothetical protein n=1 Tax=Umezawaea beigongshangensis TaxID=2780383 RepID=UPI0018F1FC6A|nr:hypothetical protein [Umezawaea beigongshangensis]
MITQPNTWNIPTPDGEPRGLNPMLLEENLARDRMRDAESFAEAQRLARRLVSARRWRRLSGWAAKRAAAVSRAL